MKIKLSTYLVSIVLCLSIFPSISHGAIILQQTDKTASGDVTLSSNLGGQTIGTVAVTSTVGSIVINARSTNGGGLVTTLRLERCTDSSCSMYDQRWYGYTSSARTTAVSQTITSQGDYSFDFTYAKDVFGSGGNTTGVTLTPGKYYRFFPEHNYSQNATAYGCSSNCYANGSYIGVGSLGDQYFIIYDTYGPAVPPPSNGLTQIISFSPSDGTTTPSTSVTYTYQIYIADGDLGFWSGYRMLFYDQMQPIGLGTYFIDNVSASTTGYYTYSTTTVMSPGNHIVNACLQKYYLGNIIGGFDLSGNSCQYHQFVVGTSTFVGNLFQNGISSIQSQVNTLAATSSLAVLGTYCNPFSGFDIVQCVYALLIPTSSQLKDTMNTFYSDFLTRAPWGYGSVAVADLLGYGSTATSSLAASNLTIVLPNTGVFATATSTSVLKGKSMTFIDWNQMASSSVQSYWSPALAPLNSFLNIMMGGGFIFWLYHFFKKMRP